MSHVAFASLMIAYCGKHHFLATLSLLCPCPLRGKSHCQKMIDRNGIHLMRWASMVISRLPHILHLRKVSTCLRCSCPLDLLVWERIIVQVTKFSCVRLSHLYGWLSACLPPIMLYMP